MWLSGDLDGYSSGDRPPGSVESGSLAPSKTLRAPKYRTEAHRTSKWSLKCAKLVTLSAAAVPVLIAITVAVREKSALPTEEAGAEGGAEEGVCLLDEVQRATLIEFGRLLKASAFTNGTHGCDYNSRCSISLRCRQSKKVKFELDYFCVSIQRWR